MSWRIVATVFIVVFSALIVSATTAGPIHEVTDTIADMDDDGGQYDAQQQADQGLRAYGNLFLIMIFGTIAYGAWYLFRREVSEGQL